ncbi:YccF domain-containing protein [Candidatus Fermentibacterales bacterium]|nr:YccF domain-containing protein [Candidatus Fermentibacterales bacterium]
MSLLGNLLWIVLGGGLILALEYFAVGLLMFCTFVGIPFGVQCMKLAWLSLLPFGKEVRSRQKASGCVSTVMNVLWIVTGGIVVSLTHVVFALLCALTIIGIPFAKQHMKLASLALAPFGRQAV